jgi:hypothetical protein
MAAIEHDPEQARRMATNTRTATGAARMASSARDDSKRQARHPARRPEGQHHGRIVSHAPGRMRVRLNQEHRDPAAMKQIEQQLGGRSGVTSVSTDHRTGSLLVQYDHVSLAKDEMVDILFDVGVVARDLLGAEELPEDLGRESADHRCVAEHSAGAVSVLDALTDLDNRISRLTGGKVDLKLLVPAGLGLLALRQVALNGLGLGQVPGYVLLWYTFDSFYKLHQRKTAALVEKAAERVLEDPDTTAVAVSEIKTSGG